jgi:hypothetical protein
MPIELAWNHTTLRALKVDPAFTYLQVLSIPARSCAKVAKMVEIFGDEVPAIWSSSSSMADPVLGLPLVRYTTEERLEEIMQDPSGHGCPSSIRIATRSKKAA